MSKSLNRSTFIGHLGADPEVRYLPDGKAVCTFNIATSVDYTDSRSQQPKTATEWHRIVAYAKRGEVLGEHLKKGSRVYLETSHRTRSYEAESGAKVYVSEFIVSDFNFLGDPKPARGDAEHPTPPPVHPIPTNDQYDDDIPF
jgi:single-strand DNA-binding protein